MIIYFLSELRKLIEEFLWDFSATSSRVKNDGHIPNRATRPKNVSILASYDFRSTPAYDYIKTNRRERAQANLPIWREWNGRRLAATFLQFFCVLTGKSRRGFLVPLDP
jgi:hypothetical protein